MTANPELTLPTITEANGEVLEDRCLTALTAIYDTEGALRAMAPKAGDYPDPGRMEEAVAQHERRMKVLTELLAEMKAEYDALVAALYD